MRLMRSMALAVLMVLLAVGTAQASDGRACGGRTVTGSGACCLSGTVTLGGKPVSGALVVVTPAKGDAALTDVTEHVDADPAPTYGFSLHEAPLAASPGDVLLITVSYNGQERQVEHTVGEGEQWLDIALEP